MGRLFARIPKLSVLCLALFLTILGARLWLINEFGSDLPFWDQWDLEGKSLYKPYFEGKLSQRVWVWFAPFAEHRPFFTRALSLGLLIANGQWDARLQMVVNAMMVAAIGCGVFLLCCIATQRRWSAAWCLIIGVIFVLPFGWQSTLAGFHSMYFFLLGFSIFAIWFLGIHPPWSLQWCVGCALGVCALFTITPGLLATSAVLGAILLRALREGRTGRRCFKDHWPTLVVCVGIPLLGLLLKPVVERDYALQAQSVTGFLKALAMGLAWPNHHTPILCLVNWLPFAVFVVAYLRGVTGDGKAERFSLGLGCWLLLLIAAIAFFRGGGRFEYRITKYMTFLGPGLLVNFLSMFIIHSSGVMKQIKFIIPRHAFAIWLLMNGIGLGLLTIHNFHRDLPSRKRSYDAQIVNVAAFVATDRIEHLTDKPRLAIPHPRAAFLAKILREPTIQKILPVSVRKPLRIVPTMNTTEVFREDGYDPAIPALPWQRVWGSYSVHESEGEFRALIRKRAGLPYLQFEIAGHLGQEDLSLITRDTQAGTTRAIVPPRSKGASWKPVHVRAPGAQYLLVATDNHAAKWFAFSEPKEMGALSVYAAIVAEYGSLVFLTGSI